MQSKARTPVTVVADLNREYALRSNDTYTRKSSYPHGTRDAGQARRVVALHHTPNTCPADIAGKTKGQLTPSRQVGVSRPLDKRGKAHVHCF